MASEIVLGTISRYLKTLRSNGIPVTRAVLYGSYARGEESSDSDMDVLVLSPLFDEDPRAAVGKLWRIAWEVDSHIEPVPVGERRFNEDDVSPLLQRARDEGVMVA